MVSFRNVISVIGSLILLEYWELGSPISQVFSGVAILLAAVFYTALLHYLDAKVACEDDLPRNWQTSYRLQQRLSHAWPFAYPMLLAVSGWVVACQQVADGLSRVAALLLLFAPYVAASACRVILCQLTSARRQPPQSSGCAAVRTDATQTSKQQLLGEMTPLLMCLAPALIVGVLQDSLTILTPQVGWIIPCGFTGLLLLAIAWWYPTWLGAVYGVRSLQDKPLQAELLQLARAAGALRIQVAEVPSCGTWTGAAVVGWLPGSRVIWLGDALIDKLSREQLHMVFLHEVAHVRRKHFLYRLMPMIWSFILCVGLLALSRNLEANTIPDDLLTVASVLTSCCVMIVGLGLVSKSCELDADLGACELARKHCQWATGKPGLASSHLAAALTTVIGQHRSVQRTWMHPSLRERLVSLAKDLTYQKSCLRVADTPS